MGCLLTLIVFGLFASLIRLDVGTGIVVPVKRGTAPTSLWLLVNANPCACMALCPDLICWLL
jgi:hypothetical protein